jgi:hypothetical protein
MYAPQLIKYKAEATHEPVFMTVTIMLPYDSRPSVEDASCVSERRLGLSLWNILFILSTS